MCKKVKIEGRADRAAMAAETIAVLADMRADLAEDLAIAIASSGLGLGAEGVPLATWTSSRLFTRTSEVAAVSLT